MSSIHVPSPFGTGCDEQAENDAFEQLCGGHVRAFRLLHLWQDTYATPWPPGHMYYKTKEQVFRAKAKRDGFTDEQVEAFFHLQ